MQYVHQTIHKTYISRIVERNTGVIAGDGILSDDLAKQRHPGRGLWVIGSGPG